MNLVTPSRERGNLNLVIGGCRINERVYLLDGHTYFMLRVSVCRFGPCEESPLGQYRSKYRICSPSTNIFRVADGGVAIIPSRSFVSLTWHPNLDLQCVVRKRS